MSTAAIDQNNKSTWTAYNETTGQIERVRVDAVLGAIEIFGVVADANVPTSLNNAKIDENHNGTITAWNDTTGKIETLRCGSGGELLIKT